MMSLHVEQRGWLHVTHTLTSSFLPHLHSPSSLSLLSPDCLDGEEEGRREEEEKKTSLTSSSPEPLNRGGAVYVDDVKGREEEGEPVKNEDD